MQKFWFKYLRMMAIYSQAQFQWFQFSHRAIPETLKAAFADLLNGTQRKKYGNIKPNKRAVALTIIAAHRDNFI